MTLDDRTPSNPLPDFPADDATLDLLWSAIHPGSDAERSSVGEVCDLYSELAGSDRNAVAERISDNFVAMRDPMYHPNDVIEALIREVRRLRAPRHKGSSGFCTLGEFRELTGDLRDDVELVVLAPTAEKRWGVVSADVSVHLEPGPAQVLIDLQEGPDA